MEGISMKSDVNYGLWVIMHQCSLIDYNKCTMIGNADGRSGYNCVY